MGVPAPLANSVASAAEPGAPAWTAHGGNKNMWHILWTEFVRLGIAFGITGLVIWFWYWLMDSLGTF